MGAMALNIAKRIIKLRKELLISRKELSEGVVSYARMGNIEAGQFEPTAEILEQLAEKLNVPKMYLTDYRHKDPDLEESLRQLHHYLEQDFEQVHDLIHHIRDHYPYISSIEQEIYYYLLECCYLLKLKQNDRCTQLYETHVRPLINENYTEHLPAYIEALYHYVTALKHYYAKEYMHAYQSYLKQLPLEKSDLKKADVYYNIALTLLPLYDYQNAIKYAKQALNEYTNQAEWVKAARTNNLLGVLHWETSDYIQSESYLLEALDLVDYHELKGIKDRVYHNLGLLYSKKKDYPKAYEFFTLALNLKKRDQVDDIVTTYRMLITLYLEQGEISQAKEVLTEAKIFCQDDTDVHFLQVLEAQILLKEGRNADYEKLMRATFQFFRDNEYLKDIIDIGEELGDYYQRARKYKQACYFYKLSIDAYHQLERKGGNK